MRAEDFEREDVLEDFEGFSEDLSDDDDEQIEALAEYDDDDDDEDEEAMALSEYDDDDDDDESEYDEDAEFLLPFLAARGIARLIRPHRPRRYRRFRTIPGAGRGVRGAVLRTRRGTVRVRLPRSVVPMSLYKRDMARLTARDNRLNARINRTQRDLSRTDKKAVRALALANGNRRNLVRLRKKHDADLARLRKEQKSSSSLNLIMNLMQVQGLEDKLADHTHPKAGEPPDNIKGSNDSTLFMLLPLMMGEGSDDNTALMMMAMMMGRN